MECCIRGAKVTFCPTQSQGNTTEKLNAEARYVPQTAALVNEVTTSGRRGTADLYVQKSLLHHGSGFLGGHITYNAFFENFEILDFVVIFTKKLFFEIVGSKSQISKIQESQFVDLNTYLTSFLCFVCTLIKNCAFDRLPNICHFLTQNRGRWRHKSRHN